MIARDIMTTNLIKVSSSTTVREAAELMFEHDIRHLPVVDEGSLIGLLSDRDLNGYAWSFQNEIDETTEESTPGTRVGQLMHSGIITCNPEQNLTEVIDLMLNNKIGSIVVTDSGDQSKAVGIISYMDVLRSAREKL